MLLIYSYDQHSMTDHHHLMRIMIANTYFQNTENGSKT